MTVEFDYTELRKKIKGEFITYSAFANAMGMSKALLNAKLTGSPWKPVEMEKAMSLLKLPMADLQIYFFARKVKESLTIENNEDSLDIRER